MSEFREYHKNYQTIAQLQELQDVRRLSFLEDQKQRREEQFSFLRDLKQICPNIKFTKKQQKTEKNLQNEISQPKPKFNYQMKNILMLSEWMMAAPEDLEDYLLVPCPKGTRVSLSVADIQSILSQLHYKNGVHMIDFKTNLPNDTILDCIYNKSNNTVYILDVLIYAGRDVVNCDTAFRRFWIKSKFVEDEIRSFDADIKLKTILDFDLTNPHSVYEIFQKYPMFDDGAKLDGFLFYHKESSYTYGETPLVLWSFPFMIDELLTMFRVNPQYNYEKPANYTNYLDYIKEFNEKLEKKKNRKGQKSQKMEVEIAKEVNEDFTEDIEEDEMEKMINLEKFGGDV